MLEGALKTVAEKDPSATTNPRYRFLEAVQRYHEAVNARATDPGTWIEIGAVFSIIEAVTEVIAFYNVNYQLLCTRNAGPPSDQKVPKLFEDAKILAHWLSDDERCEALGHLYYNWSRYLLLGNGSVSEAFAAWVQAAAHRMTFYESQKQQRKPYDALLAAAQQVAKMRHDFRKFFPQYELEYCGVSEDYAEYLRSIFGDALNDFSAKK